MSSLLSRGSLRRTNGLISRSLTEFALAVALLGVTVASGGGIASAHGRALSGPSSASGVQNTTAPRVSPSLKVVSPIPSVHEVAQTTTLHIGSTGPATATCPQGEFALGGGWSVPAGQNNRVYSATLYGNTWSVYVTHPSATRFIVPLTVTAYVECLSGATGATVIARRVSAIAQPHTFNSLTAFCNAGEAPVGFGVDLSASGSNLELQATNAETFEEAVWWNFWVYNHDSVAHTITGYVNCLSNVTALRYPLLGIRTVSVYPAYLGQAGGYVYANETETDTVACPSGYVPAGGGLDYKGASQGIGIGNLYQLHASTTGWQGSLFGVTTDGLIPLMPSVWGVCLSFS